MKKIRLKVIHEPVYVDIEVEDSVQTLDEIMGSYWHEIDDTIPLYFHLHSCETEIDGGI